MSKFGINFLSVLLFMAGLVVGFSVRYHDWWMVPVFFVYLTVTFWSIYYIENRKGRP